MHSGWHYMRVKLGTLAQCRHHKSLFLPQTALCLLLVPMTSALTRFTAPVLRNSLLALALSAPLWQLPPAQAQVALPNMGDGAEMTTSEERRLGDRIIRSLYRDPDYIDDPQLHAYVMGIWHPLVQAAKARGDLSAELEERFAWQVLLGRDKSINAFALPGGYLGVHLGLIGVVSSRDELATVLAHELTHVTQRHIARMFGEEKKNLPFLIAGMVLGALAASKHPDAANAMIVGGQAAAIQNQLSFSRSMEREADRIGYSLLAPAGFAPQGAVSMFEKLQHASRLNDNGSWPYLRSHPLTTERIADMQTRVPHDQGKPPTSTMEHAMMAGRARVLSRPGTDKLRQWIQLPQMSEFAQRDSREQAAQLYVAALSQLELKNVSQARGLWSQLHAHVQATGDAAAKQQVQWLGAEIELAASQPTAAWHLLEDTDLRGVVKRPTLILGSQALLGIGQPNKVSDRLQSWVVEHPQDATAWRLLSQAWQAQNQSLRAVRAEAEARVAHYDYAAAVDRFKAAQDLARRGQGDHIEASIIDTRLRSVEDLLREQAREK